MSRCGEGSRLVLVTAIFAAISMLLQAQNLGPIRALLRAQVNERKVVDRFNTISSSGSSEEKQDHATSYQKRMSYYRTRYNYHPAESKLHSTTPLLGRAKARKVAVGKSKDEERKSICGSAPSYDTWFAAHGEGSANREDSVIYNRFFKGMGSEFSGTFVELGAYDGIKESNSLFFETCAGWDGILIEANPLLYDDRLVANRPRVCVCVCVFGLQLAM